jgi:hypothetical protein
MKLMFAALTFIFALSALAQSGPQIPLGGSLGVPGSAPTLCGVLVNMTSDGNYTLTPQQYACNSLYIVSSATLTATRVIFGPANYGQQFTITNATTGGQALQINVVGGGGNPVTIPNGQTVIVNNGNSGGYTLASGGGGGTSNPLGAVWQVSQFPGNSFDAQLSACLGVLNGTTGGTCDGRNYAGDIALENNIVLNVPNSHIYLPCALIIASAYQVIVPSNIRNVYVEGCAFQGGSSSGFGGTQWQYTGTANAFQIGTGYTSDTKGFHMDNVNIDTSSGGSGATAIGFYRVQEIDLRSLYLTGDQVGDQTGIYCNGSGNYCGGTFDSVTMNGYGTGVEGVETDGGTDDGMNASTFMRLHIVCPTSGGAPISGTYGVSLPTADGNTWIGGDIESCNTMFHLGGQAQNNTIVGLRNENSTLQYVADTGSKWNYVATGGTFFNGELTDAGEHNSFWDAFHRTANGMTGDWYASQQDATITNHTRLGTGLGNERGLQDEYQTDFGNRWTTGLSDGTTGEQFWNVSDLLNNVNRISIGQWLSATANVVTNVIVNNGGCYNTSTAPTLGFSGGGGSSAAATANMVAVATSSCSGGYAISTITVTNGGSAYTSQPTVTATGSNQVSAPHLVAEIATNGGTGSQTAINSAGTGAVVLNGSNNSGTGGTVFGSGGGSSTTVAEIDNGGNATFDGTLTVDGISTFISSISVRNTADAEVDATIQAGASAEQKESYIYKSYTGQSEWFMLKDTANNWVLNTPLGAGIDAIKAYNPLNSGDLYLDSENVTGTIRLNFESGSGTATNIYAGYWGGSPLEIISFSATGATPTIQVPSLAAASGHYCLQVDDSGFLTNTGAACPGSGSGIANIQVTLSAATYSAGACTSAATATMTGVGSGTGIHWTPSSDVSTVTGWGSTGGLTLISWPTTNTANYRVCNPTGSSITTTGSTTWNLDAQ